MVIFISISFSQMSLLVVWSLLYAAPMDVRYSQFLVAYLQDPFCYPWTRDAYTLYSSSARCSCLCHAILPRAVKILVLPVGSRPHQPADVKPLTQPPFSASIVHLPNRQPLISHLIQDVGVGEAFGIQVLFQSITKLLALQHLIAHCLLRRKRCWMPARSPVLSTEERTIRWLS